jgi:hypothetical protein
MHAPRPARHATAAALCLAALAATAGARAADGHRTSPEWWGNANIGSHHFGDESDYLAPGESFNEFNPGVGVEAQWQPVHAVAAGWFHNSLEEGSFYAVYQFTPFALGRHVRVGAFGGVVTGYPGYNDGGLAPAGGLVAKLEWRRVGANLVLLPPLEDVTPATLGLQLKFRFR